MADAVASPELNERGMVVEVEAGGRTVHVPGAPVRVGLADGEARRRVPALGAHTREVLTELELAESEIRELAEAAVIAVAEGPSLSHLNSAGVRLDRSPAVAGRADMIRHVSAASVVGCLTLSRIPPTTRASG
ncbi:MAG TPA: CoA transferase [Candidatus Dormibacteraeota bacterium]|nr:CoA transferase [Candidatus Dormibacteraeota bacterium]